MSDNRIKKYIENIKFNVKIILKLLLQSMLNPDDIFEKLDVQTSIEEIEKFERKFLKKIRDVFTEIDRKRNSDARYIVGL